MTGDHCPLQYMISGEGPSVILVHGYGMTMAEWPSRMINGLSRSFSVIRFNLRGVAGESDSELPFTIPLAAEDLYELVTAVEAEAVNIIGYSMGGMITQEFAIHHPELTGKIVLISTHCGGAEAAPPEQWVLDEMASTPDKIDEYIQRAGRLLLTEKWRREHPDPMSWFPDYGEPTNQKAVTGQYEAMSSWEGTFSRLDHIISSALVISGDEDIVVPPLNASILASGMPDARHIIMKNGGHGAIFQYPEDMADIIRFFFEEE
ncbi:MAG: alpha/beta hydrolase [Methanomicrobiaceae archaeon]|nr:alpha/beta hydrolase [Methanomicrobiaceae archaeon]